MFYLLFLLLGCFAFYSIEKQHLCKTYIVYLFSLLPFIGLWIFMVGGQYNVGTDYQSYMAYFVGNYDVSYFAEKGEYCFAEIVSLFQSIGIYGQFFFYIFSAIAVLLYIQIAREVTTTNYTLFFFLFITVTTLFHTQMNGLRQCIAVYFSTLAFLEFIWGSRFVPLCLMFIAIGFHSSAIALVPLFFFTKISFPSTLAKVLIISAAVISLKSFDDFIADAILFTQYDYYAETEYFQQDISLLNKLTKLAYLPIYLLSMSVIKQKKIEGVEMRLFQFGLLAYLIKTIAIVSTVTNRFGYYFFILSMLPIFYYLRSLYKERKLILFWTICAYILLMYAVKVVLFPTREYLYDSILRTYF